MLYQPKKWFWVVTSEGKVWSSEHKRWLGPSDFNLLVQFLNLSNSTNPTNIANVVELRDVLIKADAKGHAPPAETDPVKIIAALDNIAPGVLREAFGTDDPIALAPSLQHDDPRILAAAEAMEVHL